MADEPNGSSGETAGAKLLSGSVPSIERLTTGRLTIENAQALLTFYELRGPVRTMDAYLGLIGR